MFKLLNLLAILPALWRFVRDMAKVMEETIPEDGFGNQKLAAVDKVLRVAIQVSDDTDDRMEEKLSALGAGLTESAVTLLKTTGELQSIAQKAKEDVTAVAVTLQDEASGD